MDAAERYTPPADIVEREDGFHVFIDMPGVDREGLTVDVQRNELIVTGKSAVGAGGQNPLHTEFGPGEYKRAFTLSDVVDREGVRASLKDGVLDLFLPKSAKSLSRRIEIAVD